MSLHRYMDPQGVMKSAVLQSNDIIKGGQGLQINVINA